MVSVLEAFKQLHDSKKRGTQSLADVPVEHLAKAAQRLLDYGRNVSPVIDRM